MNTQPTLIRSRNPAGLPYAGLLAALAAVITAGYLGSRAFATIPDLGVFNLYLLAIVTGVASFFSPCAFPLLPSYFSFRYHAGETESAGPRRRRSRSFTSTR